MNKERRKGNGIIVCITVFVICVALVCTAIGLTHSVLNKFALEYTGYEWSELKGMLNGVLDKDTEKIEDTIDNPYSAEDVDHFYAKIKDVLFLKDSYDLDTDTVYDAVFSHKSDAETARIKNSLMKYGIDESDYGVIPYAEEGEESKEGEEGSQSSSIMNLLYDILTNIDSAKLKNAKNFSLQLTDREVASFVNSLLMRVLSDPDSPLMQSLGEAFSKYNIALDRLVALNQISFFRQDETSDVMLKATASVNTREVALSYLESYSTERNMPPFIAGIAKRIIKKYIPEKTFATVTMGLNKDKGLDINLNRMDDEDMDALFSLIGKFTKTDIRETVNNKFSEVAGSFYKTIEDTVDIEKFLTADHEITVPVFDMALDMTVNKELENKGVSKIKLEEVMDIIRSDPPSYKEYDFRNWYRQHADDLPEDWIYVLENDWNMNDAGDWVYTGSDQQYKGVTLTEDNLVKFEDELLKALQDGYGLDGDLTFDEVITAFTDGGEGDGKSFTDMFDADKLRETLKGEEQQSVAVSDRMIAAIVNSQMDDFLSDTGFGNAIELAYTALVEKEINGKNHNLIELGLTVDLDEIINSASGMNESIAKIISALLPQKALLKIGDVDITLGLNDDEYQKISLGYNNLSEKATGKYLDILKNVIGFDTSELNSVSEKVRDVIENMNSVIPVTLGQSQMVLPEIYETLAYVLNGQLEEQDRVDRDELETSLKLLFREIDFTAFDKEKYEKELKDILSEKYPLKEEGGFDKLKDILDGQDIALADILDSGKLKGFVTGYNGEDENAAIRAYIDANAPEIDGNQILALVWNKVNETLGEEKFAAANPEISSMRIIKENARDYLEIDLSASLAGFLGESEDDAMQLLKKILPDSTLIGIKVEITEGVTAETADTQIMINNGDSETLLNLISKFDSGNSIDDIKTEIARSVTDAFESMRDSMDLEVVSVGTQAKLRLPCVFSFADKQLSKDKDFAEEGFDSDVNLFRAIRIMLDDGRVDKNSFKAVNAEGEANAVAEIKKAYFIKDDIKADTFDELTAELGENADITSKFNLDDIRFGTPSEVVLKAADLGGIFKNKIGEDAKFDNIVSLEIEDSDNGAAVNAIVGIDDFESLFDGADDMAGLLKDPFYVAVTVRDGTTEFAINGYGGEELKPLYKVMNEMGTNIEETLSTQGAKISDSAKDAFDKLENNIGDYEVKNNAIYLPDIFGILSEKLDNLKDGGYTSPQIQQAIQGLYNKNEAPAGKGTKFNYDESTFVNNPINTETFDLMTAIAGILTKSEVQVTDRELGSYINDAIKTQHGIDIKQLKILTSLEPDEKAFLSDMNVPTDETLVLVTAKLTLSSIMGDPQGNGKDLVPDEILVSFVFTVNENGDLEYNSKKLNAMDASSLGVILALVGSDDDTVDQQIRNKADIIKGAVDTAFASARAMGAHITYEAIQSGEGRGLLKFSK